MIAELIYILLSGVTKSAISNETGFNSIISRLLREYFLTPKCQEEIRLFIFEIMWPETNAEIERISDVDEDLIRTAILSDIISPFVEYACEGVKNTHEAVVSRLHLEFLRKSPANFKSGIRDMIRAKWNLLPADSYYMETLLTTIAILEDNSSPGNPVGDIVPPRKEKARIIWDTSSESQEIAIQAPGDSKIGEVTPTNSNQTKGNFICVDTHETEVMTDEIPQDDSPTGETPNIDFTQRCRTEIPLPPTPPVSNPRKLRRTMSLASAEIGDTSTSEDTSPENGNHAAMLSEVILTKDDNDAIISGTKLRRCESFFGRNTEYFTSIRRQLRNVRKLINKKARVSLPGPGDSLTKRKRVMFSTENDEIFFNHRMSPDKIGEEMRRRAGTSVTNSSCAPPNLMIDRPKSVLKRPILRTETIG